MSEINENPSTENATESVAETTTTGNDVVEEKATEAVAESAGSGTIAAEEVKTENVEAEAETEVKEKYLEASPVLKTVALGLEKMVEDRSKTNLEPLTEKELMAAVGSSLAGITVEVVYNPENKKEGCFAFTEFGKVTRVPEEGCFTFGTDYSVPAK